MKKKQEKEEIKTFIKERLAELLNIDPQSIDENAFLVEDLGTTSIMIVDLLVVEEEYGVDMQSRFDLVEPVSVNLVTDRILENMEA